METIPENKMPILFIGHGSPMNLVLENDFTQSLKNLKEILPRPKAILVFSAHWVSRGIYITGDQNPEQIYDFYGFPENLYQIHYKSQGLSSLAEQIFQTTENFKIRPSYNRGIDHAAWAVLKHIYPEADIPVLEMSMDYYQPGKYHYELGKNLAFLRKEGVLMIGSGNLVHNLGMIRWEIDSEPYQWALRFDLEIKEALLQKNHKKLVDFNASDKQFCLAHPSYDHYLPLLPVLGLQEENEKIHFLHESIQNASISMRSFLIQ